MLSISHIINFLEPNQVKIQDPETRLSEDNNEHINHTDDNSIEKDINTLILPPLYDAFLEVKKYYNYKITGYNTFLKSVLGTLDHNYLLFSDLDKINYLKDISTKMVICLEQDNLHKKFGYSRKKLFKKQIMKDLMMKDKTDFDNIKCDNIKQYTADYFGINILVIIIDDNTNTCIGTTSFIHNGYNSFNSPPCLNILLQKRYNRYSPILHIGETNSVFKLSKDLKTITKLDKIFDDIKLNRFVQNPIQLEPDTLQHPIPTDQPTTLISKLIPKQQYNLSELNKMKLTDIQMIAIELQIPIKSISKKTGKSINTKKSNLIHNIIDKCQ